MPFLCLFFLALAPFSGDGTGFYGNLSIYAGDEQVYPYKKGSTLDLRIYGGEEAPEGAFPYMVYIIMETIFRKKYNFCSAALLSERWVLTAAHCIHDDVSQLVVAGKANLEKYFRARTRKPFRISMAGKKYGLQEKRISNQWQHPKYDGVNGLYDIGLMRVKDPFVLDRKVKPIKMSRDRMRSESECTIAGWGLTPSGLLFTLNYHDSVQVLPANMGCQAYHGGPLICLKSNHTGTCKGDSGSPLVCNNSIWGVCSFGVGAVSCGQSQEKYYTEVYPMIDWLEGVMEKGLARGNTPTLPVVLIALANIFP